MASTLDDIAAAFTDLANVVGASDYADQCAIGVWTDDPMNPGVTAVVFQGKLYALVIPDSYTRLSGSMLSDIVNGTVLNAYIEWDADRRRLMKSATG